MGDSHRRSADDRAARAGRARRALRPAERIRYTVRYAWALLLARIYEVFPLLCPKCGRETRIIAFITTDPLTVRAILAHLGETTRPPRIAPAQGPPLWEAAGADHDPTPAPTYEFDQRIAW